MAFTITLKSPVLEKWIRDVIREAVTEALEIRTTQDPVSKMLVCELHAHTMVIKERIGRIMATLQDIQAIVASDQVTEDKILQVANALVASNKDLTTQLGAAISANDPNTLATIFNQLTAHNQAMEAALATLSGTPTTAPTGTPPGQPVVS